MKNSKEKYVTQTSFNTEIQKFHHKIDGAVSRLSLAIVKNSEDIQKLREEAKNNATKSDVQIILNHIDAFTKKIAGFDQEEMVQSLHLKEARIRLDDHEKRLLNLESPR